MDKKDLFGLCGRALDGKYDVERVVARGGFGVVYRAEHRALRKTVAIKVLVLPGTLDDAMRQEFLRGFEQEARLVAGLTHPAVVRALDFGVSPMPVGGEAPWMVMEWVEGRTLADDLVARRGSAPRSPAECLGLLKPVFEALAEAHERGVTHRDIKPANVMVVTPTAERGDPGTRPTRRRGLPVRLLDFGVAKVTAPDEAAGSGGTATHAMYSAYSLPYASPEQVGGTRTGPWTDVHALALVLVEMLTHHKPYADGDSTEVLAQVVSNARPTPAKFGVEVGPWEPVLQRALAYKPAARFADAGEFLAALEADVPGARSPGAPVRSLAGALTGHRPAILAPTVGVAFTVVVSVTGYAALRHREDPEAQAPAATALTRAGLMASGASPHANEPARSAAQGTRSPRAPAAIVALTVTKPEPARRDAGPHIRRSTGGAPTQSAEPPVPTRITE